MAQAMKQHRNKKTFLCQAAFEVHMARPEKKREKTRRQSLKNLTKITVNTEEEHGGVCGGRVSLSVVFCVCQRKTIYNVLLLVEDVLFNANKKPCGELFGNLCPGT